MSRHYLEDGIIPEVFFYLQRLALLLPVVTADSLHKQIHPIHSISCHLKHVQQCLFKGHKYCRFLQILCLPFLKLSIQYRWNLNPDTKAQVLVSSWTLKTQHQNKTGVQKRPAIFTCSAYPDICTYVVQYVMVHRQLVSYIVLIAHVPLYRAAMLSGSLLSLQPPALHWWWLLCQSDC